MNAKPRRGARTQRADNSAETVLDFLSSTALSYLKFGYDQKKVGDFPPQCSQLRVSCIAFGIDTMKFFRLGVTFHSEALPDRKEWIRTRALKVRGVLGTEVSTLHCFLARLIFSNSHLSVERWIKDATATKLDRRTTGN